MAISANPRNQLNTCHIFRLDVTCYECGTHAQLKTFDFEPVIWSGIAHARANLHVMCVHTYARVSASHACRGPWFKPQRLHSSFTLKASDFVPAAFRDSSLDWGRRELKQIIYYLFVCTEFPTMHVYL